MAKSIRTGGTRAAEQQLKDKEKGGSRFGFYEYFKLDPPKDDSEMYGESAVIRLITDEPEWAEAKVHSFIPTKDAPADKPSDKKWRPNQDATCRYTTVYDDALDSDVPLEDDCFICDNVRVNKFGKENQKPTPALRIWAVGVVRKAVKATQEHVDKGLAEEYEIGQYPDNLYEDETVEKEIDGKTVTIPRYVILNFGMNNFFDKLLGFNISYGTVVDRDYRITRKGKGTETDYVIAPLDVVKDQETGKKFDIRNPAIAARYQPPVTDKSWVDIIQELVFGKATNKYYNFYFDTTKHVSWEEQFPKSDKEESKEKTSVPADKVESKPATAVQNDEAQAETNRATREAMRERLMNRQKASA